MHINFYSAQHFNNTTIISQPKLNQNKRTISFTQSNIQEEYDQISSRKQNCQNRTARPLRNKLSCIIQINKEPNRECNYKKHICYLIHEKYQFIYMWDNVDMIIQIIESQIGFNYQTIDLYYSQYYFKEYEDSSFQCSHFIRELVQLNKPLEYGYGFKSHCIYINDHYYKLQYCHRFRRTKSENNIPTIWQWIVNSIKNILLKAQPFISSLRQQAIFDYNPR